MTHYVYRSLNGRKFIGTRKLTTGIQYEARTSVTQDLSEARIFNTKSAATNAGRSAGLKGEATQVRVSLGDI